MLMLGVRSAVGLVCVLPLLSALFPPAASRVFCTPRAYSLVAVTFGLSCAGLALYFSGHTDLRTATAFVAPLIQTLLIVPAFRLFVRLRGREPEDVFLNFKRGLFWDRALAMFLAALAPAAIVVL